MEACVGLSRVAVDQMHGRAAIDSAIDRVGVYALARQHRVLALVGSISEGDDPADGRTLRHKAYGRVLHAARLSAEAERVVLHLQGRISGLRLVKGPALALQAWPQPALREFDDIDFRCQKGELATLVPLMSELGYTPVQGGSTVLAHQWHFGWGVSFLHEEGTLVEFNHRMFPPHFPWPERFMQSCGSCWQPLRLDACDVMAPTPAMHLLICCAHAVWHGWERLAWIVDIAGLLESRSALFGEAETLAAASSFLRESLYCGCGVAGAIFGPFSTRIPLSPRQKRIVVQALARLDAGAVDVSPATRRRLHHQVMSPAEQVAYVARWLITPGDSEFRRWGGYPRLPSWALWPLRWVRMGGKAIPESNHA